MGEQLYNFTQINCQIYIQDGPKIEANLFDSSHTQKTRFVWFLALIKKN